MYVLLKFASHFNYLTTSCYTAVSGWTPAQIAIPIIIAVSLFLIFGLILFLYWKRVRRRSGQPSTISDAWNSLTRAPRRWLGLKPKHLPPKDRYLHSRSSSVADIRVESATPLQFSRTHSLEREEHVEEQVGLLNRPPPLNSASVSHLLDHSFASLKLTNYSSCQTVITIFHECHPQSHSIKIYTQLQILTRQTTDPFQWRL